MQNHTPNTARSEQIKSKHNQQQVLHNRRKSSERSILSNSQQQTDNTDFYISYDQVLSLFTRTLSRLPLNTSPYSQKSP
jgi:hypothetical protein